jgi:hypothetical protein
MYALDDFVSAETAMRDLLDGGGLQQPDRVEYWSCSVAFFWEETKPS